MNFDNDADFEQMQMEQDGNTIARLAKKGICSHGWIMPVIPGKTEGEYKCGHCGKIFPNADAAIDAHWEFCQRYL
jgi:hypothetical protein